jgi:hypothetical protein
MRDEVVIVLVLALVIASAGMGYFVGNSGRQTVATTGLTTTLTKTLAPNGTCDHTTSPPTPILSAVMLIPPNSMGFVCVTYARVGMQTKLNVQQYQQEIWNGGTFYLLGTNGTASESTGINLTAISASLTQNNETVEYRMRTSGNSTGAYSWWAPGTCPGFPLVVGSNVTGTESSLLNQYFSSVFYGCPAYFFGDFVNGATGISFVNVSS